MAALADVVAALEALYTGKPGLTTVATTYPTTAPEQAECPYLFFDVGAPASTTNSHRRTLLWPIDLCLLVTRKTSDLAADLALAYPWPETLVGWLDEHVSLGGLLAASVRYQDPIMQEIGPLKLWGQNYIGFILNPIFPIKVERTFSP